MVCGNLVCDSWTCTFAEVILAIKPSAKVLQTEAEHEEVFMKSTPKSRRKKELRQNAADRVGMWWAR